MLHLISLGIWDEKDLSLKALEAGRSCEKLYWEQYTTRMNTSLEKLEKLFGKKVELLERGSLEEDSGKILEESKTKNIAVLVGGDALSATTHSSLILDCRKAEIPFRIIHGSSILTAAGESGLSLYKFGETVSVPCQEGNFRPSGFYETILRNRKSGLHSLVLLDVGMNPVEGIKILLEIEKNKKEKLFQSERIVSLAGIGSETQEIVFDSAENLAKSKKLKAPAVLVLPGRLNEFEKEFLEIL